MRTRLCVLAVAVCALAGGAVSHAASSATTCKSGYYLNVSGNCVHRPGAAASKPAGASAKCRDGTYSFSQHHSGTCSSHGGVAVWYR